MQKILPQRFDWRDPNLGQSSIDLGELHRRGAVKSEGNANRLFLFTKKCEQEAPRRGLYSQVIRLDCCLRSSLRLLVKTFGVHWRRKLWKLCPSRTQE